MSGFQGINNFGSLTTSNGQRLTFKDFDKDGDGKITEEEYNQVLKDVKLDSVDLSTVDRNGDKEISEDEFKILEQKQQMQDAVNNMASEITFDFMGDKAKYIPELTTALRDFINEYADDYTGAISEMANMFTKKLPDKYEEIKSNILANDPVTIQTNVVNDTIETLSNSKEAMPEATLSAISKQLDSVAQAFVKSYTGANLETDLRTYLENWLTQTDAEKMGDSVALYQSRVSQFGTTIESTELPQLKEAAKQLLTDALNKGIEVKLGEQKVSITNLTAVLNKYSDGAQLKADIQTFIDSLSTLNKKEQIIADEAAKAEAAAEKAFTDIPGKAYHVDGSIIDYSAIPGYANNAQIHERGKGWSGSRDKAADVGREVLRNESLKSQMKQQITKMLEAKGVPFSKVESIFENVYAQSIEDTLNTDGIITGRGARGLSKKGHAYINTKDLVDAFITKFNANIENVINTTNASNKDLDLYDIDYTAVATDEEGNVDTNLLETLQEGDIKSGFVKGNVAMSQIEAAQMVDRLRGQMLTRAMNMCKANGIEFDNAIFTTIFNNARNSAVASGSSDIYMLARTYSKLNPKQVVTTFTTEFKTNYTNWVEKQKADSANK